MTKTELNIADVELQKHAVKYLNEVIHRKHMNVVLENYRKLSDSLKQYLTKLGYTDRLDNIEPAKVPYVKDAMPIAIMHLLFGADAPLAVSALEYVLLCIKTISTNDK